MAKASNQHTISLTEAETEALRAAAKRFNTTPDDLLRKLFLRGLQTVIGVLREGTEAAPDDEEVARRSVRAFISTISDPSPRMLRQIAREYELAARQIAAAGMDDLRERIRREHGNIPDIPGLIDSEKMSA